MYYFRYRRYTGIQQVYSFEYLKGRYAHGNNIQQYYYYYCIIVVILFTYFLHTLISDVVRILVLGYHPIRSDIVYLSTQHRMDQNTIAKIIVCTSALANSYLYLLEFDE